MAETKVTLRMSMRMITTGSVREVIADSCNGEALTGVFGAGKDYSSLVVRRSATSRPFEAYIVVLQL